MTAVVDDWDPAVVDGLATERRFVMANLWGIGSSGDTAPDNSEAMADDAR
ncbi:hypothetical protein [Streptomyces sp. NPDC048385]